MRMTCWSRPHSLWSAGTGLDLDAKSCASWPGRHTYPLRGDKFRPIFIYHIHGFLPSNIRSNYGGRSGRTFSDYFNHMLVFTDTQYWSTSATALAFANRVMLSALSESRCLFIGLSLGSSETAMASHSTRGSLGLGCWSSNDCLV